MMDFYNDCIKDYDELVATLHRCEYHPKIKKLELGIKNRDSPLARPSIEEVPKMDLKALPPYLRYVFLIYMVLNCSSLWQI